MRRYFSFVLVVCSLLVGLQGHASAELVYDNIMPQPGYEPCGHNVDCLQDDLTVTVWIQGSITPGFKSAIQYSLKHLNDDTDFTVVYNSAPHYTGEFETDIVFSGQHFGDTGGLKTNQGGTHCDDPISKLRCDQFFVNVNIDKSYTPGQQEKIACHEIGHAVGLTHGDDAIPKIFANDPSLGCMAHPLYAITSTTLGLHNRREINATY